MSTGLSLFGVPSTKAATIRDKALAGLPPLGLRIADFDVWRQGYGGAVVEAIVAGTTATLAQLFADPGLSQAIPNPQLLISMTDANGAVYGKWAAPVYAYQPYVLFINSTDGTGVQVPPVTSLAGQDVSLAVALSRRGSYAVAIADVLDRTVDATLYGSLSPSDGSATTTATIAAAIGAASTQGGGDVLLPAGTFNINSVTLPQGVILRGKGKGATTLLSSATSIPVVTIGGDGAGLAELTLDGINLSPKSIGVQGTGVLYPVMSHVLVKRFETGVRFYGCSEFQWKDLSVSNCTNGADLRGDGDIGNTGIGTETASGSWESGDVTLCTTYGLTAEFVDKSVRDLVLSQVRFLSNSGDAIRLTGTRGMSFVDCQWNSNISDLVIKDGTNTTFAAINTTQRLRIDGGTINGGSITVMDTAQDVQLRGVNIINMSLVLSVPLNPIVLVDCITDANTTTTGDLTKLLRRQTSGIGGVVTGITTDNTPLAAWQMLMPSGGVTMISARAIARQRNGLAQEDFWVAGTVIRPPASLPYQSGTAAFTVGLIITGRTSGATARVIAKAGTIATGTLTIRDISGTFLSGEVISDTSAGSASFVGTITTSNAALDTTGSVVIRAAGTAGGAATCAVLVAVSGSLAQVTVQGVVAQTFEWSVEASLVSA